MVDAFTHIASEIVSTTAFMPSKMLWGEPYSMNIHAYVDIVFILNVNDRFRGLFFGVVYMSYCVSSMLAII